MQGESMIESGAGIDAAPMWAPGMQAQSENGELDWQAVDRALRGIARRRATLDADEARWLREAERLEIWRPLGMVSALDYLERGLGYAPRTAQDRLRVARALGALPALSAALAGGDLAFSAVRELTRVATPATEAAWLGAAAGKTLRQIEEMVADRRPGDLPGDPPDPQARTHVVRFELTAETFARLRQARVVLDGEHGRCLSDDPFVAALCGAVLDGAPAGEPSGRARFQVAMTVCARCRLAWQEGAGVQVPVGAAAVERAMCDAQHVGSVDGDVPERAYQDIPPSVARLVWRRDGGRCRVPGCRSARGLELHHLVHRAAGGSHDASNLVLTCSACHQAHHAGTLTITGTADRLEVRRPGHTATEVDHAHVDARAPAGTGSAASATTSDPIGGADAAAARAATPADAVPADATPTGPIDSPSPRSPGVATALVNATAPVGVSFQRPFDIAMRSVQTKEALRALGWSSAMAPRAAAAVAAAIDPHAPIEQWIREALRRCPKPVITVPPSSG